MMNLSTIRLASRHELQQRRFERSDAQGLQFPPCSFHFSSFTIQELIPFAFQVYISGSFQAVNCKSKFQW